MTAPAGTLASKPVKEMWLLTAGRTSAAAAADGAPPATRRAPRTAHDLTDLDRGASLRGPREARPGIPIGTEVVWTDMLASCTQRR
jgi:hypothetical protein